MIHLDSFGLDLTESHNSDRKANRRCNRDRLSLNANDDGDNDDNDKNILPGASIKQQVYVSIRIYMYLYLLVSVYVHPSFASLYTMGSKFLGYWY